MAFVDNVDRAAEVLIGSSFTIALTGAGVSVESGIPDFRSSGGLWERFDPAEYATISAFMEDPHKVWEMLDELDEIVENAWPNPAHRGMGELEKMGMLGAVITQNVDNLHQAGGSEKVIEYHGNSRTLSCLWCGRTYSRENEWATQPPLCDCGKVLKPDVVFFGEPIPQQAMEESFRLADLAKAVIIAGTSAVVYPANSIPSIAKQNGAKLIEINIERTHLTESITDIFLQGEAGRIVPLLVEKVRSKQADGPVS